MKQSSRSTYIHFNAKGLCLIHREGEEPQWVEFEEVRRELQALQREDGVLEYSFGYEDDETQHIYSSYTTMIVECGIIALYQDPSPAANFYFKSYSIHLERALSAARSDVEGTAKKIAHLETLVGENQPGTGSYAEFQESLASWKKQLKDAQRALQRLRDIDFELSSIGNEDEAH